MGARPSTFKRGGGFLNNVDGTITGYQFTDEFNGEAFVPGKNSDGKPKFHGLNFVLSVRVDEATEDVSTNLFAGGFDNYDVSEDGLTLTNPEGGPCFIGSNTALGKLLDSWVAAAGHENDFDDDPDSVNFESLIGRRARFIQANISAEDEAKLVRAGKNPKRVGKDGKAYNRQNLQIGSVYDASKLTSKSKAPAIPVRAAKATKGKALSDGVANRGGEVLKTLLGKAKDNVIARDELTMLILKAMPRDPQRDAVLAHLAKVENVVQYDFVVYDEANEQIGLADAA